MAATLIYPKLARNRGRFYWFRPSNLWSARRKYLRRDHSREWRDAFQGTLSLESPHRTTTFSKLLDPPGRLPFRFVILGDTGEGDRSQYGLLPLIRALAPDFLIINGDVAYPSGEADDFLHGFFEPYRGLGIPVWAVPGNHEYYSTHRGAEFHQIFCTRAFESQWERHGLRLVPQPGTYWELKDPRVTRLCVLGVDTLMSGRLDGDGDSPEDGSQLQWLSDRLTTAQREGLTVIVLFHIPGLVRQEHDTSTRLVTLHRLVSSFSCVRLVVCGHEHNYQRYAPAVFARYVGDRLAPPWDPPSRPDYIVCGGGGAYLQSTLFRRSSYAAQDVYPTAVQWRDDYVSAPRRLADGVGLSKSVFDAALGAIEEAERHDRDVARFLSLLLVEVGGERASVTPYFLDSAASLFFSLPDGTTVSVTDPSPPVSPEAVRACAQFPITLWGNP